MSMIKVDEDRLDYALNILSHECTELYEHYFQELCNNFHQKECNECPFYGCETIKAWLRKED